LAIDLIPLNMCMDIACVLVLTEKSEVKSKRINSPDIADTSLISFLYHIPVLMFLQGSNSVTRARFAEPVPWAVLLRLLLHLCR